MIKILAFFSIYLLNINQISCHGYLNSPIARSSAFRKFPDLFPSYYSDNQMFCGGFQTQWIANGGKCGICGEDYAQPKVWEKGGINYRGISVETYNQGEQIEASVLVTANHLGYFQFKLCNVDGTEEDASQECLDNTILSDIEGKNKIFIGSKTGEIKIMLHLPADFSCDHCVFQWKYNTGNSWGTDPVTGVSGSGLGPQEQFAGCADITIVGAGDVNSTTKITELTSTSVKSTTLAPTTMKTSTTLVSTPTMKTTTLAPTTMKTSTTLVSTPTMKTTTLAPTTTVKTTTKSSSSDNELCYNGDGIYVDYAIDCKGYYQCVYSGTSFEQIHQYKCSSPLLYDVKYGVCNWPEYVTCVKP